ncbi:metallophosphoesterase family protein [Conexibacter woesei]|uniref:metallophosphoesterase family protein n=1 Tax=Conexibacter woesei TaxID=191495 RepID=UPI00042A235C|nr:metallophosphoesterase family protein [Conexibacter woesei]
MLAILYDIHGNRPALEAVLADAREHGATRFLLGGDYSAFGAWPVECVEILRGLPEDTTWIQGNWERWQADPGSAFDQPVIRGANAFVREALGPGAVQELGGLPRQVVLGDTLFVHASPQSDVVAFGPEASAEDAAMLLEIPQARIVFGHTHLQFLRSAEGGAELVNPGSVGLPWDGDTRAAYATWDDTEDIDAVTLRRVTYDVEESASALDALGAPWATATAHRIRTARFDLPS